MTDSNITKYLYIYYIGDIMNNNDIIRYRNKINKNNKTIQPNKVSGYFKNFIIRTLVVIVLFLFIAIFCKSNTTYKDIIYKNVYENNLSFTTFKNFYNKYLGGISFLDKVIEDTKPVFNENLIYTSSSKYYDGVSLEVEKNYLVPVLESGIVVYIGQKENYGNVIIIQGINSIDIAYSNMQTTSVKLYDYIEKGDLLGEVNGTNLYLVYSKDGNILNYEDYLK